MGSPRLTYLQIHRYRHVVPGTRLEFGAGFNVLLGRNGTGKTTLLELIEMIWAKGFGQIADEPFHLQYAVEFDDRHIPAAPALAPFAPGRAVDRTIPGCTIHVDVENVAPEINRSEARHPRTPNPPTQFRYQVHVTTLAGAVMLTIHGTPMGATVRVTGRDTEVPIPVLGPTSWPIVWNAPRQSFGLTIADHSEGREANVDVPISEWAWWCDVILDNISGYGRFDESLGAFHAMTSGEYRLLGSGLVGARWEIERSLDSQAKVYPFRDTFFSRQILKNWASKLQRQPSLDPPEFQTSIRETPLASFLELTGYSDVLVRSGTPSRERSVDGLLEHLSFGPPEFRILLPNNRGEIPAKALSYGEKRLLSFLWHLACNPRVVIADELVNGFHHEWIEECVKLIGDRQAFLASQNPLLLDCLPLASEEYVRRCFITCRRNADGQMLWSNLSPAEAADFYRAYERNTRYTHEILRSKELW